MEAICDDKYVSQEIIVALVTCEYQAKSVSYDLYPVDANNSWVYIPIVDIFTIMGTIKTPTKCDLLYSDTELPYNGGITYSGLGLYDTSYGFNHVYWNTHKNEKVSLTCYFLSAEGGGYSSDTYK